MSVDLERLVVDAAPEPTRDPDVDEIWRVGRRRRRWEHVAVVCGLLVVLVGAVFTVPSLWDGEVEILDPGPADVPAGWQDIKVSGVVFSVPAPWPTIDVDDIPVDRLPAICHIDVPTREAVYVISQPRPVAGCPGNWDPRAQATRVWVFLDPMDDPEGGRWGDPAVVNGVTVVHRGDPQFGQLEYHLPDEDVRLVLFHPTDSALAEQIAATLRRPDDPATSAPTCQGVYSDGAADEPGAPARSDAIDQFLNDVALPNGAHIEGSKIVQNGQQIGTITITSPPAGGYAVSSAQWCLPNDSG